MIATWGFLFHTGFQLCLWPFCTQIGPVSKIDLPWIFCDHQELSPILWAGPAEALSSTTALSWLFLVTFTQAVNGLYLYQQPLPNGQKSVNIGNPMPGLQLLSAPILSLGKVTGILFCFDNCLGRHTSYPSEFYMFLHW